MDGFASRGIYSIKGYFGLPQPGERLLLASSGPRPGMLLSILQGTGQSLPQGLIWLRLSTLCRLTNPELALFDDNAIVSGYLITVFADPFLLGSSDAWLADTSLQGDLSSCSVSGSSGQSKLRSAPQSRR